MHVMYIPVFLFMYRYLFDVELFEFLNSKNSDTEGFILKYNWTYRF